DGLPRAMEALEGAADEVLARLGEHLDGDPGGDTVLVNEGPGEGELDFGSGREADLDFLEAEADEKVEILELFLDIHGDGEGLVAVAQVDAAPDGGARNGAVRPGAVGQGERAERAVFGDGAA